MDLPGSAPETSYSPQNCCSENLQERDSSAESAQGWAEPLDLHLPAHSNAALTALGSSGQKICTHEKPKNKQGALLVHNYFIYTMTVRVNNSALINLP